MSHPLRIWLDRFLFLLAGLAAIVIPMIPMGLAANSPAFPDLLFAVMVAWTIRQPSATPMFLVAFLALLGDALLLRPIGLWAVMLLLGVEAVRLVQRSFRDMPFLLEWAYVAGLFVVLNLLQSLVMLVTFMPQYGLATLFWHVLRTVAIYPLVVLVLRWGLGVRQQRRDTRPNRVGVVL